MKEQLKAVLTKFKGEDWEVESNINALFEENHFDIRELKVDITSNIHGIMMVTVFFITAK